MPPAGEHQVKRISVALDLAHMPQVHDVTAVTAEKTAGSSRSAKSLNDRC